MNKHLYITILAGGAGTRFWPASSKKRPKQLLPLATSQPMLTETVRRALTLVPAEQIRILTTTHLSESIQDLVRELPSQCFKIEPLVRGTAAALTWAAWDISQAAQVNAAAVPRTRGSILKHWDGSSLTRSCILSLRCVVVRIRICSAGTNVSALRTVSVSIG